MKKILIHLVVMLSFIPNIALAYNTLGSENSKPIFSQLLENEDIESFQIPTFLVQYVLSFDEDMQKIKPFFKGSRFINISFCEKENMNFKQTYSRLLNQLDYSNYKSLTEIIDNHTRISIKALINEKYIRELVVLLIEEDSFIAISMTGKIDPKDIANAISKLSKANSNNL